MQTTPDNPLAQELLERSQLVLELDGPQIEAWVSGLFPMFGEALSAADFVEDCRRAGSDVAALVCRALVELATGDVQQAAQLAVHELADVMPAAATQIGSSELTGAWSVSAPFGRSIMLGFDAAFEVEEDEDARHSILIELGEDGELQDLQLAGSAQALLEEAAEADDRVIVQELDIAAALEQVEAAWPTATTPSRALGAGVLSNEHFVRRRMVLAGLSGLDPIEIVEQEIDIRRGLDDAGYKDANRAARSTLQAALGDLTAPAELTAIHEAWISVLHGDAGELAVRERDALLWLEWADWLGVGIMLTRAGPDAIVSDEAFVDYVNRCPEVSSTIDKADRDYAEWAFRIAIEVLADAGVVRDERLTAEGRDALGPAFVAAWS